MSAVKKYLSGKLTNTPVRRVGSPTTVFPSVHSFEGFGQLQEKLLWGGYKMIIGELITRAKDKNIPIDLDIDKSI